MATPNAAPSERTRVRRLPDRARYDAENLAAIVDAAWIAHVAFPLDGGVHSIPTAVWREGNHLYIHGANNSRMAQALTSCDCSVCVAHLDGLVLARSAFHHSMNFRSVVIYGRFEEVTDPAVKAAEFDAFVEHVSPGRAALVRAPSPAEMAGTRLLRIPLQEAAAKSRAGGVIDAEEDMDIPVWAGVVPLGLRAGCPEPDAGCAGMERPGIPGCIAG